MKKKLVAFAVTAAMVVTSAVPVFAWQADGQYTLDTAANKIVVDSSVPKGISDNGMAGAINEGKSFKTTVDFNATEGQFEYVLGLAYNNGANPQNVKLTMGPSGDAYVLNLYSVGGTTEAEKDVVYQKTATVKGIVEFTWTFTEGWLDVTVNELGNTASNAEYVLSVPVPGARTNVESLALNAYDGALAVADDASKTITSGQAVIYQNEAPVYLDAAEFVKVESDGTTVIKDNHDNPVVATQPVAGEYYRINSITLDDGTVVGWPELKEYVTVEWVATKANGVTVPTDTDYTRPVDGNWTGYQWAVADTGAYDGCKITAVVKPIDRTGVFGKVVAFEDANAIAVQQRLAGANRYETAFKVADQMKPVTGFKNIFVATGTDYADALSATSLAAKMGAPILLVNEYYEDAVKDYIDENAASYNDTTIYIVGGTGAVSQEFQDSVDKYAVNVERLAGADRYETNIAVLKAYDEIVAPNSGKDMRTVLVASGTDYPDALSASATGLPVLIVGDSLTKAQRDYLQDELAPVSGTTVKYRVTNYEIIGGRAAVSDDVKAELSEKAYIADADNVTRLSGSNRYATNKAVMDKYVNVTGDKYVFVASGNDFADALTGGVLAAQNGCALVLVNEYNTEFAKDIAEKVSANNANYGGLVVVGGEGAVSNATVQKIA